MEDKFIQPPTAQLELIQELTASVQCHEQQLASIQKVIATNEDLIRVVSKKSQQSEDDLEVTREELNKTTVRQNHFKEQLTKQLEGQLKFLAQLTSSSQNLNEAFMKMQRCITATNEQNAEKLRTVLGETERFKNKLAQEVIATHEKLETALQKVEKELAAVKEENQICSSETENNLTQLLKSTEKKVTESVEQLLINQCEELKQDSKATRESLNQVLQHFQVKKGTKELFSDQNKSKQNISTWAIAFIVIMLATLVSVYMYFPNRIPHGGLDAKFKPKITKSESFMEEYHHKLTNMEHLAKTLLSEFKTEISKLEVTLQKYSNQSDEIKNLLKILLSNTEFKTKISDIKNDLQSICSHVNNIKTYESHYNYLKLKTDISKLEAILEKYNVSCADVYPSSSTLVHYPTGNLPSSLYS